MGGSKPLGHYDSNGFEFSKELLDNDSTFGVDFDRIQWDTVNNQYVIVEHLLCDKKQYQNGITPYTSHPNRYFKDDKWKFLTLWDLATKLHGKLYLVNYSKKDEEFADQVLLMDVEYVDESKKPIVKTVDTKFTRSEFSKWFRELNSRGRR
jgi:hypothetical protein